MMDDRDAEPSGGWDGEGRQLQPPSTSQHPVGRAQDAPSEASSGPRGVEGLEGVAWLAKGAK